MKWICSLIGSLVGIIGEVISPWPAFITDTARTMSNNPVISDDPIARTLITMVGFIVAYIIFPSLGFGLGYLSGWILQRRIY